MLLKNEFRKMHMRVHVAEPATVNAGTVSLATAKASYDKAIKSFRSHYAELSGCWDPNQSDAKKLKEAVDANLGADETAVDAPLVKTGTAIASLQTTIGQSMSALQTLINNNAGGGQ